MNRKQLFLCVVAPMLMASCAPKHYQLVSVERTRIIVDSRYDQHPDEAAVKFLEPYKRVNDSIMGPIVGQLAHNMAAKRPESDLSNLLSDILIWSSKDYNEQPVLAVYNMGGIRSALTKGDVTYGDVLDVAPFENKICFTTLKGDKVMELFRQIAYRGGEGVSKGVELVIKPDASGEHNELVSARLHGKEIDPEGEYRVATLNYLLEGNDGMPALRDGTNVVKPEEASNNTRFLIMNYFRDMKAHAKKQKQLVVLHTNDTHSTIMPLNPNLENQDIAGRAGFLRRINMIKEERKQNPDLLLFDSGDFSQGSGYYTLFKGEVEIGLMNEMGYDAATIGNHEFDFGMDNMAKLFRMANFPIVCSNYDCKGTVLEDLVKPYITLRRGDVKIGIFALAPKLKGLVFDGNCEGITFLDPAETAQKYIDLLRKQEKCDLVICVSHLGWSSDEYSDQHVFSQVEGCDLVLGGHTHTYMPTLEYTPDKNGKRIPVDQNGKHAAFVGKLVLNLEK